MHTGSKLPAPNNACMFAHAAQTDDPELPDWMNSHAASQQQLTQQELQQKREQRMARAKARSAPAKPSVLSAVTESDSARPAGIALAQPTDPDAQFLPDAWMSDDDKPGGKRRAAAAVSRYNLAAYYVAWAADT